MPRRAPVSSDKRLRKNRPGARHGGDHGTAERWGHSGFTLTPTDRAGILAARATEEHVLDRLRLALCIDARASAAAWRLKEDFQNADIAARTVSSYSGIARVADATFATRDRTPAQQSAYRRWRAATTELAARCGDRIAAAVCQTVCYDAAPTPATLKLLQTGLDRLADLYRITE